jgi:hypothetical protein
MQRRWISLVLGGFLVFLPVSAQAVSILLTKTVGTGPDCATSNEITVPAGTMVTYCYTVGNTGSRNLVTHTLTDDVLGTIVGPDAIMNLDIDQELSAFRAAVATQTVKNTGTWVAMTDGRVVTDSAMATVTVLETGEAGCTDQIDNDLDMLLDCVDPDCFGEASCQAAVPVAGSFGLAFLALVLLAAGTLALSWRRRAA